MNRASRPPADSPAAVLTRWPSGRGGELPRPREELAGGVLVAGAGELAGLAGELAGLAGELDRAGRFGAGGAGGGVAGGWRWCANAPPRCAPWVTPLWGFWPGARVATGSVVQHGGGERGGLVGERSEEHTSEL